MKKLIILSFIVSFFGCDTLVKKTDYQKLIQGNWQCNYVNIEGDTTAINLFFKDSLCHFLIAANNENTFRIKNDLIVISSNESRFFRNQGTKQIFKIIRTDKNSLALVSLKGWLNKSFDSIQQDTLQFARMKVKNKIQIRRISFYASGCFGTCPSFKLEMNPDDAIKFEGFRYSKKEGLFYGKSTPEFWEIMKDKCQFIDFPNWKEKYETRWTDDQYCLLVFETNKGLYKVFIYGDDKEPRAFRNVISYIFSNYADFNLQKAANSKVIFKHDKELNELGILPEEKLLRFVPEAI